MFYARNLILIFLILVITISNADDKPAKVDKLFEQFNRKDSPGASVAIIQNGKILYTKGYGMGNLDDNIPITPTSKFGMASLSKQFTAMCIALLHEEGKLNVEDDVRKYIPELPYYGRPITIRHLIHHTSGLRDYLETAILAGNGGYWLLSRDYVMDLIKKQKALNFEPGAEYSYCNTGYFLMSEIIERLTGMTLRQFAHERIFKVLNMSSTYFADDNTLPEKKKVFAYAPNGKGGFKTDLLLFSLVGSGGLLSNVIDFYKFDQNFYNNKLGKGGQDLIKLTLTPGKLNNGQIVKYGFGLQLRDFYVFHSGTIAGFRNYFIRVIPHNFTVVLLTNLASMQPANYVREIVKIYLNISIPIEPEVQSLQEFIPKKEIPSPLYVNEDLKKYEGFYYSEELSIVYHIQAGEDYLYTYLDNFGVLTLKVNLKDDTFTGDGGVYGKFENVAGKIIAFTISVPQARGFVFKRSETEPICKMQGN